jgi:hypothetical protein
MVVRRSKVRQRSRQVTPEAVELFRRCRGIEDAGLCDRWEEFGGRRREYLEARVLLQSLLGLLPGDENVMDAADPDPPVYLVPGHAYPHDLHVELSRRVET